MATKFNKKKVSLLITFSATLLFLFLIGWTSTSLSETSQMVPELSPNQQIKNGVSPLEVKCNEGLELVFKFNDKSPACVKKETALKISGRGWGSPHWNEEVIHLAQQESTLTRTLIVKVHDKYSFNLGQPSVSITERIVHPKPIEKFEVWRQGGEVMKITDVQGNDIIDKERGGPNYPRGGSRVMPAECAEGIKHAQFATPLTVNVKPDVTSDILIEYPAYIVRLDDEGNYQLDFESLYETEIDFVSDVEILSFQTETCKIHHHVYSNVIFYQITFKFTD